KLLSEKCDNLNDFFFSFSDAAQTSTTPCPPTDGGTYKPVEPLAALIGEQAIGIWKLEVSDAYDEDGGSLDRWELNYCISGAALKPAAPTALNLKYEGNETISLHWLDNSDNESGFYIQRAKNNLDFTTIKVLNSNDTLFQEKLPSIIDIYQYRVLAFNRIGPSFSNTVQTSVLILEQLTRPNQLTATYQADSIAVIGWLDNADNESNYIFEADFDRNGAYDFVDTLTANIISYELKLSNTDTISVRVKAFNKYTSSDYSSKIDFSLPSISFIERPTALVVSYIDGDSIRLNWVDNSDTELQYRIQRKLSPALEYEDLVTLEGSSTSFSTRLPSLELEYNYRVYGINPYWESLFSNTISASIKILASGALNESNIAAYPNPANNVLSIYNPQGLQIDCINIYNIQGSLLKTVTAKKESINISDLIEGIYLLQIQTENNQYSIRFIKQ
ncbi:MAG: hypothetical protein ACI9XJ_002404, partial [Marivirga sp.]